MKKQTIETTYLQVFHTRDRFEITEFGESCFANNILEFDIFNAEEELDTQVLQYKESDGVITNTKELFDTLYDMFFCRIEDDENIKRFEYKETRNFYKMFLDWRITNASLNYMISSFMRYWRSILLDNVKEKYIYVNRWGDMKREGYLELWTDISDKTESQLINLAIVRIKEEQDFLDNTIIKYIEVLHDVQLVEEELYLKIKYGTSDEKIIVCLKNGISLSLAKLLVQKYLPFMIIDLKNDILQFREGVIEELEKKKENKILIQELKYYL